MNDCLHVGELFEIVENETVASTNPSLSLKITPNMFLATIFNDLNIAELCPVCDVNSL